MSIKNRVHRLEANALKGPGILAPEFKTEGDAHVSATMPGMGALHRFPNETNMAFEQRVFRAVNEALRGGSACLEQLSDDTLKACMGAGLVEAALDNEMVRAWVEDALRREEGVPA